MGGNFFFFNTTFRVPGQIPRTRSESPGLGRTQSSRNRMAGAGRTQSLSPPGMVAACRHPPPGRPPRGPGGRPPRPTAWTRRPGGYGPAPSPPDSQVRDLSPPEVEKQDCKHRAPTRRKRPDSRRRSRGLGAGGRQGGKRTSPHRSGPRLRGGARRAVTTQAGAGPGAWGRGSLTRRSRGGAPGAGRGRGPRGGGACRRAVSGPGRRRRRRRSRGAAPSTSSGAGPGHGDVRSRRLPAQPPAPRRRRGPPARPRARPPAGAQPGPRARHPRLPLPGPRRPVPGQCASGVAGARGGGARPPPGGHLVKPRNSYGPPRPRPGLAQAPLSGPPRLPAPPHVSRPACALPPAPWGDAGRPRMWGAGAREQPHGGSALERDGLPLARGLALAVAGSCCQPGGG